MSFKGPYFHMSHSAHTVEQILRFQINGTSDPDNVVDCDHVVSDITRSSAGVFVVTFRDCRYPTFLGMTGSVMNATAGQVSYGLIVQAAAGGWSASAGTLTLHVVDPYTDASPAAVDPTDDNWVFVRACFGARTLAGPASRAI